MATKSRGEELRESARDAVNKLLGPPELAEQLHVPLATLYSWRSRGQGPPALKVGKHLRWRQRDVDLWLESCADERDVD
jgi:predicted DNA-binding transcriptional regulator AlpA